ncbi:general transcription factor 3C polypeptide 3 [Ischnura elegans]|uniref:general transcription factor 3C polypeptide 3 n=1 Tax=Ischnura elegans TaxID=197161 RepID=UPI001ED86F71|nr:general transcription factor 3C polypeptide 3 [Ischnura elegans]
MESSSDLNSCQITMEVDPVEGNSEQIIVLKGNDEEVEFELNYGGLFQPSSVSIECVNDEFMRRAGAESDSGSEGEDLTSNVLEGDDQELKEQERQVTERYLDGQLTFSEYAALMGGTDIDIDGPADVAEVEPTPSVSASTNDLESRNKPSTSAVESNSALEFELELEGASRKRKRTRVRKRRRMPPALQGLMGEANLRYARGDREMAVKMCLEVIRQAPTAPEPFQTLAGLHEELGEPEKSLQFALIAAHLSPGDSHEWQRLAEMSLEQGNERQAATCLARAVKVSRSDPDIQIKLAQLLDKIGDKRLARWRYFRALEVMLLNYEKGGGVDATIPPRAMDLAKSLARMYHGVGELEKARHAIEFAFHGCPKSAIIPEDINLILELLIELGEYDRCLHILMSHTGVVFNMTEEDIGNGGSASSLKGKIHSCIITEDLPIDIHVKMLVCLIHLNSVEIVTTLIKPLFELDPEDAGDLYLDVAEALMAESCHELALRLLNPLVQTKNYGLAAVWLRKAECLRECGKYEDAVDSYKTVVQLAPGHAEARLALSEILRRIGRQSEALEALIQDPEEVDALDPVLLYQRCLLLLRELQWDSSARYPQPLEGTAVDKTWITKAADLLNTGMLFLSRHCAHIRDKEDLYVLTLTGKSRLAGDDVRVPDGKVSSSASQSSFSLQSEWDLLKNMCSICLYLKWFGLFQRLAFSALGSNLFNPRYSSPQEVSQKQDCRLLALLAAFYNKDTTHGYYLAKDLVLREPSMPRTWDLFSLTVLHSFEARHNRFIMRMFAKSHSLGSSGNTDESKGFDARDDGEKMDEMDVSDKEDNAKALDSVGDVNRANPSPTSLEALALIHAHNCLISGTYKYALFEYTTLYRNNKSPLVPLLISFSLLHMACQKFTVKKHSLVVQAMALFSEYSKLRHADYRQEVHYNLGRMMHQLGLYPYAIFHYKKALNYDAPVPENTSSHTPTLDLKREIAYNLHLIYRRTGAQELARAVLEEYIVV